MTAGQLVDYTAELLNRFFPDGHPVVPGDIAAPVRIAMDRLEYCFSHLAWPGWTLDGEARFNHLHSDHMCSYLWFLSNTCHVDHHRQDLPDKLFYLNKILHSFNCMYDTRLPDIFWLVHVVGTVLGKAEYMDYLVVLQGCTVGALGGEYPRLGRGVVLSANSAVIGRCTIGDNAVIGAGCRVIAQDVPAGSLVTPTAGLTIRANSGRAESLYFRPHRPGK